MMQQNNLYKKTGFLQQKKAQIRCPESLTVTNQMYGVQSVVSIEHHIGKT